MKPLYTFIFILLSFNLHAQHNVMSKNWISYLRQSNSFSEEFYSEMDKQLKPQITKLIGKELNWSKVILFVPPIEGDRYEVTMPNGEKRMYFLEPAVNFKDSFLEMKLFWRSKKENRFINSLEKVSAEDIEFVVEEIDTYFLPDFPLAGVEIPLRPIDLGTSFSVKLDDSISHEGFFIFELENGLTLEKVEDVLNDYLGKWNENDEIIEGISIEDRGKFHNIYISRSKEESHKIYYDFGSAEKEAIGFFLRGLDKEVKGIKSLIIESI